MGRLPHDDSRAFPDLERDYIRRRGRPDFDWLRFPEASPRHKLNRPLSEARVGLLSTAGAHPRDEKPIPASGPSRAIPIDTEIAFHHIGYDTKRPAEDPEVVWPVRTLQRLAEQGVIAAVSRLAVSTMGAVFDGQVVLDRHVPVAVDRFRRDRVDLVMLVPA